jgi:hypothetical protein
MPTMIATTDLYPSGTDPYGNLLFAVGSGDDFWCFDYATHGDGTMTLHAMINSETGSFIQNAEEPVRVPYAKAVAEAVRLTDRALEWAADNEVRLDMKGWNQDPAYFVRAVRSIVEGPIVLPTPPRRRPNWRNDLTAEERRLVATCRKIQRRSR